ncbi:MAG TPA: hypothetical protein PK801_08005 [Aggregatilineales bacterium]|nr:hypothetical protein [Chloroflexota bacterium]HOA23237.1 hypothetical protein [Aggregatilineales bacterium]HPV07403.1 hypothetical protein [Aggregatilineales bacterium]HQA68252.1 hypothetical protein [Aggregatilineales bacterium]HQE19606.1 hypothetical protein [Aggregatilineales bacterium]
MSTPRPTVPASLLPWLLVAGIVVVGAVVITLTPAEATLGQVVKVVFVHVAFSRAGAIGLYIAGLAGLAVLARPSEQLVWWMQAVGWAGLILFAIGFIVSGVAQMMSWGGITLQEPRVAAGANVLAVALIAQIAALWLPWPRVEAVLHILVAAFQAWVSLTTPNVLHPAGAITSSTSGALRLSSAVLLLLALLLGAWIVWMFRVYGPLRPATPLDKT